MRFSRHDRRSMIASAAAAEQIGYSNGMVCALCYYAAGRGRYVPCFWCTGARVASVYRPATLEKVLFALGYEP